MQTQVITSESNEKLKIFKSLLSAKGIKEHHQFILSGRKLVDEFLSQKLMRFKLHAIVFDSENWTPAILKLQTTQKFVIPKATFKELDVIGTGEPLLIIEFNAFEAKDFQSSPQELEVVCPLGDPRNLDALIRSAVGLGAREFILTKESAHPFLPQSVKASSGAVLYAHFKKTDLAINEIPVVRDNMALDLDGHVISAVKWPQNLRLWVGEEGPGLKLTPQQKKAMTLVTIPTQRVESLNAMVSASLAIWEWKKSSVQTKN